MLRVGKQKQGFRVQALHNRVPNNFLSAEQIKTGFQARLIAIGKMELPLHETRIDSVMCETGVGKSLENSSFSSCFEYFRAFGAIKKVKVITSREGVGASC